jgi:hypothetical protein
MECMQDNQPIAITLTYGEWFTIRAILGNADTTGYTHDAEQLREAIVDQTESQLVL